MENNNQNGGTKDMIIGIIVIVIFIILAFASCSGSGSKRDVSHDPDGFLGYSDSFWEWQMKQ